MKEIYMIKIWTEAPNPRLIKIKYIVTEQLKEVEDYVQCLINKISGKRQIHKLCKEVKKMIDYKENDCGFKSPEMILTMEDYRLDERSGKNWNRYIENAYDKWCKIVEENKIKYIERTKN